MRPPCEQVRLMGNCYSETVTIKEILEDHLKPVPRLCKEHSVEQCSEHDFLALALLLEAGRHTYAALRWETPLPCCRCRLVRTSWSGRMAPGAIAIPALVRPSLLGRRLSRGETNPSSLLLKLVEWRLT